MIPEMPSISWKDIWRENQAYFITFLVLFLIGGSVFWNIAQGDDILFFNQNRNGFSDFFFRYATMLGEEVAYFLVAIVLAFFSYRHLTMLPLIGIVVTAVSAILKKYFAHPRPFRWFQENEIDGLLQMIEGVSVNMGRTSFPSGHTMSAFALFTFLALCLPMKKFYNALLIMSFPVIVGLSRIYLIKHFLQDVLFGAIIGLLLGVLFYRIQYQWIKYPHPRLDQYLSLKKRGDTPIKP